MADEFTVERSDGPTPNGGDYAIAIKDATGAIVEISEHLADGTEIMRTYADRLSGGGDPAEPVALFWSRFPTMTAARAAFRSEPCIYVQTDNSGNALRVGM